MSEERTLHAYVEGGGGLCSACGHSIGHDIHGKSMSGEPPRAELPTCHETHYYCINHTCDWVGHIKPCERKCPRCGARVWKEGTDSEFKGKLVPSCLPRAGSRPSAPAPSADPRKYTLDEIRNDPTNMLYGIPLPELQKIIHEYRSKPESSPVDLQQAWTPEQCEQWMIANDLTSYDPATGYFSNGMSFAEVLAAFAAHLRGK